ncbi:MAG: hypothetical protein NTY48_00825 [Candidatus Diapherotrites archaeon]|nr:hypothetical protein [Candidatus Diapherotrites archaeon]
MRSAKTAFLSVRAGARFPPTEQRVLPLISFQLRAKIESNPQAMAIFKNNLARLTKGKSLSIKELQRNSIAAAKAAAIVSDIQSVKIKQKPLRKVGSGFELFSERVAEATPSGKIVILKKRFIFLFFFLWKKRVVVPIKSGEKLSVSFVPGPPVAVLTRFGDAIRIIAKPAKASIARKYLRHRYHGDYVPALSGAVGYMTANIQRLKDGSKALVVWSRDSRFSRMPSKLERRFLDWDMATIKTVESYAKAIGLRKLVVMSPKESKEWIGKSFFDIYTRFGEKLIKRGYKMDELIFDMNYIRDKMRQNPDDTYPDYWAEHGFNSGNFLVKEL